MSPQPMWKELKVVARAKRHAEKAKRTTALRAKKDDVRTRDRRCRFPRCPCGRRHLRTEVAHRTHEGRGGNPAGDRSDPSTMILVCCVRHKESALSLDQHTIRWEALTALGSDGPVRWLVDVTFLRNFVELQRHKLTSQWVEVARENGIGSWEPFLPWQAEILDYLGRFER